MGPVVEGILLEILKRVLTDDVAAQAKGELEQLVAKAKADGMAYVDSQVGKTPNKVDDFLAQFLKKVVA